MSLVISGAKAVIRLAGAPFAFAAGVSVTHENRLEEIPQLDNLEVAEYAENGHRCAVTLNSIKLSSDAAINGQAIANNASSWGFDDPSELKKILLQPEFIFEIMETLPSGEEVPTYIAYGAKFEGGSGTLDARGVWQGSWTFKCRRGTGI